MPAGSVILGGRNEQMDDDGGWVAIVICVFGEEQGVETDVFLICR